MRVWQITRWCLFYVNESQTINNATTFYKQLVSVKVLVSITEIYVNAFPYVYHRSPDPAQSCIRMFDT